MTRSKKTQKVPSVQAVVTLKPESWLDEANPGASTADQVAQRVIERVKAKCGAGPERVKVFSNIGSFAIAAEPRFIDQLAGEPEVLRADPNIQKESMMIEPRRKREVDFHGKAKKR
jgi:hypothetical protein